MGLFGRRRVNGWLSVRKGKRIIYSKGDAQIIAPTIGGLSETIEYHVGDKMLEVYIELGTRGMIVSPELIHTWRYSDGRSEAVSEEEREWILQHVREIYGPLDIDEYVPNSTGPINAFFVGIANFIGTLFLGKIVIRGWVFDSSKPYGNLYTKGKKRIITHFNGKHPRLEYCLENKKVNIDVEITSNGVAISPEKLDVWTLSDGQTQRIAESDRDQIIGNLRGIITPLTIK